jgi:LppX_LprAFG lipoprotein
MKRTLAVLLGALLLAACGSIAVVETPQQVVATASQKMTSDVKTAKLDMTATIVESFPPELVQSLGGAASGLSNITLDLNGKGQMQLPDKAAMNFQVKIGGVTVTVDSVVAGGKLYVKDPTTGNWTLAQGTSGLGQFSSQLDPTSATGLLKAVQSVKDLGDTKLNGTDVHHYEVVPDKTKLQEQMGASGVNAQTQAVIKDMVDKGTFHIEVWIGKDDHLLRRIKEDIDANLDLSAIMAAVMPSGATPLPGLPSNATIHLIGHISIDLHDFNSTVTVTVPSVSPS